MPGQQSLFLSWLHFGRIRSETRLTRISVLFDYLQNNKNAGYSDDCLHNTLFNDHSILFEVRHGNVECSHCAYYGGGPIEEIEDFKKAKK